jgi:HSP20 family molecular chaperone IbpA
MAHHHHLPVTTRDSFFEDPFFSSSWDHFDRLHRDMMRDARRMFDRFDAHQQRQQQAVTDSGTAREAIGHQNEAGAVSTFYPRRWMMPRAFGSDFDWDAFRGSSDHNPLLHVTDDDTKFEVHIDTHDYKPEDIKVNVRDNVLNVEADHEEKTEHGYVKRHFSRSWALPNSVEADKAQSNLSRDGVLMITAPKNPALADGKTSIPVEMEKK